MKEVWYGNGGKVVYEHDAFDRLTGVKYDAETSPRYEYEYGANGRAAIVRDHHLNWTALEYDAQNRLKAFREETADGTHETTFSYDKDNRTMQVRYGSDGQKVEYTYDSGRTSRRRSETEGR